MLKCLVIAIAAFVPTVNVAQSVEFDANGFVAAADVQHVWTCLREDGLVVEFWRAKALAYNNYRYQRAVIGSKMLVFHEETPTGDYVTIGNVTEYINQTQVESMFDSLSMLDQQLSNLGLKQWEPDLSQCLALTS